MENLLKMKNKILILSPHTDDAELGCGATIAKFVEQEKNILWCAFSTAEDSLPEGSSKDTLRNEFLDVCNRLQLKEDQYEIYDYAVRKLTDHRQKNSKLVKSIEASEYVLKDPDKEKFTTNDFEPVVIAESEEIIKNLSVSEALMFMNLNDQNAIFFKNVKTNRLNILFKRSDGNIGWLDPKK